MALSSILRLLDSQNVTRDILSHNKATSTEHIVILYCTTHGYLGKLSAVVQNIHMFVSNNLHTFSFMYCKIYNI